MGEGFGYPPGIFTDPNYPRTSEEKGEEEPEVNFNTHTHNDRSDSAYKLMPEDEAPTIEKLKINENPYCPICTLMGTDVFVRTMNQIGITWWRSTNQCPKPE